MSWLTELFMKNTPNYSAVAEALLVLGLVSVVGTAIGSIKVKGINFGVAGVLFAGIAFAHFGLNIDSQILEFVREFGLILFVYTIGVQVGPGLMSSLRRDGIKMNGLSMAIVILGLTIAILIHFYGSVPITAAVGLLSGATTNTPSLAAAQQALIDYTDETEVRKQPGLAYAIAYPFGVVGLILAMIILKYLFKIDIAKERHVFIAMEEERKTLLGIVNLEVMNPNLDNLMVKQIPLTEKSGVVISRILQNGVVQLAQPEQVVHKGDILLAVGPKEELEKLRIIVGKVSDVNLMDIESDIVWKWLLVTKKSAIGKSVHELKLRQRFGVNIARIARADIELPVGPDIKLQFGDRLSAVGNEEALQKAATELGNAPKELYHPMIAPIFIGIVLGVIVGCYPFQFPGLPAPVKLGLAGGPLLVAIVLSRIGKIGPFVWYMPISANYMLREFGIALFLACVGLKAGDRFISTLIDGNGLNWMFMAAFITIIPPITVGFIARWIFKLNYLSLCGLLAGSMTDPPALAYVTQSTDSEAPSISYATVYPLTMFLRVLFAQLMIMSFQ